MKEMDTGSERRTPGLMLLVLCGVNNFAMARRTREDETQIGS